jgi:branched-chain amino acid aminotransferase
VLEAPTSNVWWREGRRLLTPSLELPILAGVTRMTVMELAEDAGYGVEEGTFPLSRLLAAHEVFLTSSIREVMPVVAVDEHVVGGGEPGPAAESFQRALRAAAGYPLDR